MSNPLNLCLRSISGIDSSEGNCAFERYKMILYGFRVCLNIDSMTNQSLFIRVGIDVSETIIRTSLFSPGLSEYCILFLVSIKYTGSKIFAMNLIIKRIKE